MANDITDSRFYEDLINSELQVPCDSWPDHQREAVRCFSENYHGKFVRARQERQNESKNF